METCFFHSISDGSACMLHAHSDPSASTIQGEEEAMNNRPWESNLLCAMLAIMIAANITVLLKAIFA